MTRDNCEFRVAIDWLAARAGMKWNGKGRDDPEFQVALGEICEKRAVHGILTEAANYYARCLPDRVRAMVREQWGLSDETIKHCRIGWATGALFEYLVEQCGYKRELVVKSGLIWQFADERVTDFFVFRIMVPYLIGGECQYMIGRRLEGHTSDVEYELGKYKKLLVRSERHAWVSEYVSNVYFYGEDTARRKTETLIVTEGIMDCVAAHQAGFAAISPVTVAASESQRERLIDQTSRASRVVLLNDEEQSGAGLAGSLKMGGWLARAARDARIARLPRAADVEKVDLADWLRLLGEDGPAELRRLCERSTPYIDFLVDQIERDADPASVQERLTPIVELVALRGRIERERYVSKIARRFDVSKSAIGKLIAERAKAEEASKFKPEVVGDALRGRVFEDESGYYYTDDGSQPEIISNFSIVPIERIVAEGEELTRVEFRLRSGGQLPTVIIEPPTWTSRRAFVAALP